MKFGLWIGSITINKIRILLMKKFLTIAMLFFTPVLFADDDGPTIEGGVEMNISAEGNINAAVGNEAMSSQSIGAIESGNIEGDTEIGVQASGDINAAVGNKSCADQQVGTIGKKSTC